MTRFAFVNPKPIHARNFFHYRVSNIKNIREKSILDEKGSRILQLLILATQS